MGQVPTVHLINGVLVRKLSDQKVPQLVVPRRLRKSLFEMTHAGKLAAHLGSQRMYLQLKAIYYWPCMKSDIIKWCRECEVCAQCKGPPTRRHGKLQKSLPARCWISLQWIFCLACHRQRTEVNAYSSLTITSQNGRVLLHCQTPKHLLACVQCTMASLHISAFPGSFTVIWGEILSRSYFVNSASSWGPLSPT